MCAPAWLSINGASVITCLVHFVTFHIPERPPAPPSIHPLEPQVCVCEWFLAAAHWLPVPPPTQTCLYLASSHSRAWVELHVRLPMQVFFFFLWVFLSCALAVPPTPTPNTPTHPSSDPSLSALVGCHGYSVASLPHVAMRLGPTDLSWMTMCLWLWQEAHSSQ